MSSLDLTFRIKSSPPGVIVPATIFAESSAFSVMAFLKTLKALLQPLDFPDISYKGIVGPRTIVARFNILLTLFKNSDICKARRGMRGPDKAKPFARRRRKAAGAESVGMAEAELPKEKVSVSSALY